jgi:hypothetical protein
MRDRSPSEQLIQQLAAGKLFRLISAIQIGIHLSAYIATFVGLIIIKAGGYYDTEIFRFLVITLGSMPLFAIGLWLFNHGVKFDRKQRIRGYYFQLFVLLWSLAIVKTSY